jgi:hypothetical protein
LPAEADLNRLPPLGLVPETVAGRTNGGHR